MTHQRFATNQRKVQRTMDSYKLENSLDQIIAAKVAQVAQIGGTAEMHIAIGVTTGTFERTFSRDLDGQKRGAAGKNGLPRRKNLQNLQPRLPTLLNHDTTSFSVTGNAARGAFAYCMAAGMPS